MDRRLAIAGVGSGCGKTTLACALLAAFSSRGMRVAAFKCGPDYIDPMFHAKAAGVESRNLDAYLMGEEGVRRAIARNAAERDVAVIEGVMGLYDGLGGGSYASTNHISVLTDTPVILVVNPKGAALSICAAIKGFLDFEENRIRGVVLNNISEAMFGYYKKMIEGRLRIKVVGCMPSIPEAGIESRYLGLVSANEIADIKEKIGVLSDNAKKYIDIEGLLEIAEQARPADVLHEMPPRRGNGESIKLCIANDEAFSFFYGDNHDLFRFFGADIHFISPMHGNGFPDDADGLILWGGYPELYGAALEKNYAMRENIKSAIARGLPVYAEGGGFIYLRESITDASGSCFSMLNIIPGNVKMAQKTLNFGYYELEAKRDNPLCRSGGKINAHFLQRYTGGDDGDCFTAVKQNGKTFSCSVCAGNVLAGYQHLHFAGNPAFAKNFINACGEYKKNRGGRT
jgi:cobyrinic acid a,c-diamide synthase